MAASLVIAIAGTGASGGQSEREAGRSSVVPGGNAGELGLSNSGEGVYRVRSVNRNDADALEDPAKRVLVSRSECPPNACTAPHTGVAHRSVTGHLTDGTASPDSRGRQAQPLRYASASGSSDVAQRGDCPPNSKPVPGGCIPRSAARVVHGERCKPARLATVHYRNLTYERQEARQGELATRSPVTLGKTCRWARFAAETWVARARSARRSLERWERTIGTSAGAICHVFGAYCSQALAVARCESGWSMTPRAHNGQYLGMFQMGSYARGLYGHGSDRLTQARSAYAYFVASGRDWSPWTCKP